MLERLSQALVGQRVQLWWPLEQRFFSGTVIGFDPATMKHHVRYDDGDEEHVVLGREQWQLEPSQPGRGARGGEGGASKGRDAGEAGGPAEDGAEGEGAGESAGGRGRGAKRGSGSGAAAATPAARGTAGVATAAKGKRLPDGAAFPSLADAPKLFGSAQRPGSGLSRAEQEAVARQQAMVGRRVEVWWPLEQKFFKGVIAAFDTSTRKHRVAYDDGDVEHMSLRAERWRYERQTVPPTACYSLPFSWRSEPLTHRAVRDLQGEQIRIWAPLLHRFRNGTVLSVAHSKFTIEFLYDDGEIAVLDLSQCRWELVDSD
ncbi:hypothetical protein CLOM_g13774 [Closterium sp. NIES-68]|nr:hypothetical protein CLOM_g13774 [Closterium sp. NIES-68]